MPDAHSTPSAIPALTLLVALIFHQLHPSLHPSLTITIIALLSRRPTLLLLTIAPLLLQAPLSQQKNWLEQLQNKNFPSSMTLQIQSNPYKGDQRLTFFQAAPPGTSPPIRVFCPQATPPLRLGQTHRFTILRSQLDPRGDLVLVAKTKTNEKILTNLRKTIAGSLQSLPPQQSALLASIVLGQRQQLPKRTQQAFLATGCLHLLAVSGLHLGLIAAISEIALRLTLLRPMARSILVALVTTAYACVVGFHPSVLRALVMVYAILLCRSLGRRGATWNALGLAAIFSLSIWPEWLVAPGFQLSYFAVAGILLALAGARPAKTFSQRIAANLRISAAAFIATAPLSLLHFGEAAPIGLLVSILAAPIFTASLGLGAIGLSIGLISKSASYPILYLAGLAAQGLVSTLETIASFTPLWRFPEKSPLTSPLLALGILALILSAASRKKRLAWLLALSISLALAAASLSKPTLRVSSRPSPNVLEAEISLHIRRDQLEVSTQFTSGVWPKQEKSWIPGHALGLALEIPEPGLTILTRKEKRVLVIDPRRWSAGPIPSCDTILLSGWPSKQQRAALAQAPARRLQIAKSTRKHRPSWGQCASAWNLHFSTKDQLTLEIDQP